MDQPSIGFIGGGRAARIILGGLQRAGQLPPGVMVGDPSESAREELARRVAGLVIVSDNAAAAARDVVFLAIHPPVIRDVAGELAAHLRPEAVVISLAPKLTLSCLAGLLGGHERIARVIPNAPSIVGAGYNPLSFAAALDEPARRQVLDLLAPLGEYPEVPEAELEAYAILTAMGPTYLWFQLYELVELGTSFGLGRDDAMRGVAAMARGALATMTGASLAPAEVIELVPAKPIGEGEATILELYRSKLPELLTRLRP